MMKSKVLRKACAIALVCSLGVGLVGCGTSANDASDENTVVDENSMAESESDKDKSDKDASDKDKSDDLATTEPSTTIVEPEEILNYRKIPDSVPKATTEPVDPGNRTHFTFSQGDSTYVFNETETLWLYNQSNINGLSTQFVLSINGNKVVLEPLEGKEADDFKTSGYYQVFEEEDVIIYQGEKQKGDEESSKVVPVLLDTPMYLTIYDLVYKVDKWQESVIAGRISPTILYQRLAQMNTAVNKLSGNSALTDALTGLRSESIIDDYKLAYREGVSHTGFIFCSPNSDVANHDDVSIYMSVRVPEWNTYVVFHQIETPAYVDRLEKTSEKFGSYTIMADYTGELKYFLIGENGRSVYIEGVPGEASDSSKSYTPAEAAYIFDLILTK